MRHGQKPLRHGLSYTPEYRAWQTMRQRCTNPNNHAYPSYGGRGITICDRWLNNPQAFIDDMGPKPTPKHEIDRFPNNDGNYEPDNCRWATRKENDRNRRSNNMVSFNGKTLTLAEWAERVGIRADTIGQRIASGWSAERALTEPLRAWEHGESQTAECMYCRCPFERHVTKSEPRATCSADCAAKLQATRNGKLTIGQVVEAREAHASGASAAGLARRYGVTVGAMKQLLRGDTWSDKVVAA